MLDFRLKVFQSVAHNLSFTKASLELFVSQPAITKHIKELELEYGVKLFDRVGNRIVLTAAGDLLLGFSERINGLHNEAKFALSRLHGSTEGVLRLGASTTIAQYVIPAVLAKFNARFTDIELSLNNGNSQSIEAGLLKGDIDLGIVEGKATNSDLRYVPFLNDELVVFTSTQNCIYPNSVTNEAFLSLPLVLRERGSGTLEIIEKSLNDKNMSAKALNVLMYLGSTEAIKSFVKTGSGVGIVSRFALEQELERHTVRIISTPNLKFLRQFYFISPKGPEPVGVTYLFLDFATKYFRA